MKVIVRGMVSALALVSCAPSAMGQGAPAQSPAPNAEPHSAPNAVAPMEKLAITPSPDWALPPPEPTTTPTPDSAAMRVVYLDNQSLAGPDGLETYTATRVRLLKPEALPLGNISMAWTPGSGSVRMHWLRVIRQGKVMDLTNKAAFTVVRRENGLEQSVLDGKLTAFYQVPDLQVGDELEWAITATTLDPTLRDHRAGLAILPQGAMPGAFRTRLLWPERSHLRWQASPDVAVPSPARAGHNTVLTFELRDPPALPESVIGAPARYSLFRVIEFTDYASWPDVSRRLWPLFDKAATLTPDSPLRQEAARIAASTTDPVTRAEAALRLVEDRIRYVYVGMDGANMTPADADTTWTRRFGDCKGKTVVLIALLRELGIVAEPLLVNSRGGDGMDQRLPNPGLFDHVVVQATIAGKHVLLDGTRLGDRTLAQLPLLPWRFGLPVTQAGVPLEKLPSPPPPWPQGINVLDIDARGGLTQPVAVTATRILRGGDAAQMSVWFATVPVDQAQRAIKDYWHGEEPWIDPDKASWQMDDQAGVLRITLTGDGDLTTADPDRPARIGYTGIPATGLSAPSRLRRPRSQDQSLPWVTAYPSFQCWATTLRLPDGDANGGYWTLIGGSFNKVLGGVVYMRTAGVTGNVVRSVMSRRFLTPEISAAEATAMNAALPDYESWPAAVERKQLFKGAAKWPEQAPPFDDSLEWTGPQSPCVAPTLPPAPVLVPTPLAPAAPAPAH